MDNEQWKLLTPFEREMAFAISLGIISLALWGIVTALGGSKTTFWVMEACLVAFTLNDYRKVEKKIRKEDDDARSPNP